MIPRHSVRILLLAAFAGLLPACSRGPAEPRAGHTGLLPLSVSASAEDVFSASLESAGRMLQAYETGVRAIATREEADDALIDRRLRSEITEDATLRGLDVQISTHAGIVTLTGSLHRDEDRQRLISLSRSMEGVIFVNDRLRLVGPDGRAA
ncbi:BON domain-containing protein [Uliginosibacterium paludis]|uniref:BON domain-containing protein n=1 Tax=Uliginosibacterium paludis TaxID=1615952 RepID=A0ABV2CV06_9RHOO